MLGVTDTQTLYKIVDTSVEKAIKAKDEQCRLHANRLDSFENNQKDMVKEMQENNKLLAVVIDNMADMKKTRDMLFDKANANSMKIASHEEKIKSMGEKIDDVSNINESIVAHDERIKTHDDKIANINSEIKDSKTLKWTAILAIVTVIIEFLINKFGGK